MHHQDIRDSVRNWFNQNPDEELSVSDVAIKFDCEAAKARDVLRGMEKQEFLTFRWERIAGQASPCKIYSVKP